MNKYLIIFILSLIFVLIFFSILFEPARKSFLQLAQRVTSTTATTIGKETIEKDEETYAREEKGIPSGRRIVLTLDEATDLSAFEGKLLSDHVFIGQYGESAYDTLKDYPIILKRIRRAMPDFSIRNIQTSFPSKVAWIKDEREFLVMSGCLSRNSSGTKHIITYNPKNGNAFVLRENQTQTKVTIYGNPDPEVLGLLTHYYLRE